MTYRINKTKTLLIGLIIGFFYILISIISSQSARAAVACNIWADSTSIYKGQSTMIHWTSPVAPVVVNGTNTNGATQWSTGPLQNTTTYSLVGGYDSSCKDSVTVNVSAPPAPSCTFYSSKNPVSAGESFKINWNCTNATSATLDGVATYAYCGSVPCSNTKSITKDTTFRLSATGPGGTRNFDLLVKSGVSTKEFSGSPRHNLDCQSGQTNTFLHARSSWLTASSSSIPQGTNSVSLRLDARGEVCEGYGKVNVTSDGGVNNKSVDGDSEYIVSSSVSSSPPVSGLSLSGLNGQSAVISRSAQYGSARPVQAFTPVFSSGYGTLSGLAGLSPGTYTFTVSARVIGTAILGGGRVCVSPVGQVASGVGDTAHCNQTTTSYTFIITVTGGSPGLSCSTFGPTPSVINEGDTATFGWSTTAVSNVVLRNSLDTSEVNVPAYQPSYPVSPDKTTTYYVVAIGINGEERICPVTVQVQQPPSSDTFVCEAKWYQITDGILKNLNLETGQQVTVGNTGRTRMNAIGYNIEDNYMYGVDREGAKAYLARINANGSSIRINNPSSSDGTIPGFADFLFAGDMDKSGNLWYIPDARSTQIVKVDVSTASVNLDQFNMSEKVDASDIVYTSSGTGGFLYGIETGTKRLIEINTVGTTKSVTKKIVTNLVADEYTSGWTSSNGSLYFYGRNSGDIIRIDNRDSTEPNATVVVSGSASSYATTDGASCPNARDPLEKINYPFLQINGSDVIAGAKFSNGDVCEMPSSLTGSFGTIKTNGFKKHGYNSSDTSDILSGSSSAEYAATAFSKIFSSGSSSSFLTNNGYYREIGPSGNFARDLMFSNSTANQPPMQYGNFNVEGTLPCLNISQIEKNSTPANSAEVINALKNGTINQILKMEPGDLTITGNGSGIILPIGRRLTIIVDGRVNINTNITYADSSSSDGIINSPQLTIIAKNGIIIKDSVTRLDGYYDAHNNTLKTCDLSSSLSTAACNQQLIVNGGLVGKNIEWRRNFGTLGSDETTIALPNGTRCSVGSTAGGDVSKIISAQNTCAAEKINFNPLFYFNNPFSTKPGQSTISGAPLNSVELPPIY